MVTKKSSPSIAVRFDGQRGKARLVEALTRQPLISGDGKLAHKIACKVELMDIVCGQVVTKQGDADNDIYFILSGTVSVRVNDREVALRRGGEHLGEMAVVDITSCRSATAVALEQSVLAKLSEPEFTQIAKSSNQLWRNVAVCLSQRLRERSKFHMPPRSKPVVFIASSSEGLEPATCIQNYLAKKPFVPILWSKGVFEASQTAVEDLLKQASESDFAIIVLTPDDSTASRGRRIDSPRDNTVFELGLFLGRIGRNRTYIVCPKDIRIKTPSDLHGITVLKYDACGFGSLSSRLTNVKKELTRLITKYGPI